MISATVLLATVAMTVVPDQMFVSGMEADVCPEGRIVTSDVRYEFSGVVAAVDVTQFENIWGRQSASDPLVGWPGISGATPTIEEFTRTGYIAAAFHTPSELPEMLTGMFKNISYGGGPALDVSIGACGDFSSSLGACFAGDVQPVDQSMVHWRTTAGSPVWCVVAPDTDYYVNIRLSDPDDDAAACSTDVCSVTMASFNGQ